jgi:hypothetical protein
MVTDEVIMDKIHMIREKKVMPDRDLAALYGVETKQLKRQGKRNRDRFPPEFMFELSSKEFKNWRSQMGTSNFNDKMGLHYAPYAFTEQGGSMLSTVLNSKAAIHVSIRIVRVFTRLRETILTHKDMLLKLEKPERKISRQENKTKRNEKHIQLVFQTFRKLLTTVNVPRPGIGFRRSNEK